MIAENVTRSRVKARRVLRQRLAVLHSAKAKSKQARPAINVPRGARWRNAMASKSARGAW